MSKYENYDVISQSYDVTRTAVGINVILGLLFQQPRSIDQLTVLDGGCGTGNYAKIIDEKVKWVICGDFSLGMLGKARQKLSGDETEQNSQFVRIDLSELPFAPQSFDNIICNQSLHHIDEPGNNYKNLRKFFAKAHKVLKDDGAIIISTITQRQMRDGVWWAELIQPAIEKMTPRFASDDTFETIIDEAGFYVEQRIVPVNEIIQLKGYFDHNSLRDKGFRDGDSHFTLLFDDELQAMLDKLDELEANGEIAAYIKSRDALRKQVGQFTVFSIKKKPSGAI